MTPTAAALAFALLIAACGDDRGATVPGVTTTTVSPATTTAEAPTTQPTPTATTTTTTTTAPEAPPLEELGELALEPIGERLPTPIFLTVRDGDNRLFVVSQNGLIQSMTPAGDDLQTVLDLRPRVWFAGERGLLGLAFHPDEPERMFVHYSHTDDYSSTIEEYRLPAGAAAADPSPVALILSHPQPASNHNGGMIAFGTDGYLYIALGDGGGGGDTYHNGQDPSTLLGAILRIDVDRGDPYGIPPDNPFADGEDGAPEVWLWGLRNPWRFSFDGEDIWIADVGQGAREEIDLVPPGNGGGNLGWPIVEGLRCYDGPETLCEDNDFIAPVYEYSHESGRCSVSGGYVYRGATYPGLVGGYVFGDFCTGEIFIIRVVDGEVVDSLSLQPGLSGLTSFGVDHDGELYVLAGNQVYRVGFEG